MKTSQYMLFLLVLFTLITTAQVPKDTLNLSIQDTITPITYQLEEVYVSNRRRFVSEEERKQYQVLRNRVIKTYPYAKIAADRLTALNTNIEQLKSEKDKKTYLKIAEKYLTTEFEDQLKNLSRKQGQILVKLIHRQTGVTTYNLIHDLKNGWKAFWSNNIAQLYDINLKTPYDPYNVSEDFVIESILQQSIDNGLLPNQPAKISINYSELIKQWRNKQSNSTKADNILTN